MELEEAIGKRRSVRHYAPGEVTREEVDKLLWAASNVPAAGHIHAIKVYEVRDRKRELCSACLGQRCVEAADVNLVVAADYTGVTGKYRRRGYRYATLEAGHVGQNISLMAVSLGLGCVMIGAFRDEVVKQVLGIPEDPIYVIPVGRVNAVQAT